MQVQTLNYPFRNDLQLPAKQVLAAGFFDGLHLGHQNLIKTAVRLARIQKIPVAVLTFDRHPALVYQPESVDSNYQYLTPLNRKLELLEQLGVDTVYIAEFNPIFAHLEPKDFVEQFLMKLHLKALVAGFDWTFGPKTLANMDLLRQLVHRRFEIYEIPSLNFGQRKISSTHIRASLKTGQMAEANLFLGYNYQNEGLVVHGYQMGRQLGFPTANLSMSNEQFIPRIGVYVSRVKVGQTWWPAMTSIGRNITFKRGDNPLTIEANLLDFDQDLYGKTLQIEWLDYLRDEVKFADASALIAQLHQDQENTELYFRK
ncbi:riboflavin biosynthesis protein RibF [Bombilactobacillus folatiphilus]|uniref:Riboflavin biosynthesis protein n=1 Tax=Bombilactobacillus folatiphilus TaxID=2923362 RepID=A0ABY4P7S8_9LACO|nr:riboflavin biosynthesis protein RibF [Bombilactobacillus folatiphilus]UQS81579.1 riboflavin biosynthesis protein RibF [Bombilactobacillus folatiphilus]